MHIVCDPNDSQQSPKSKLSLKKDRLIWQTELVMMTVPTCFIALLFAFVLFCTEVKALSSDYYDKTCPNAESTITKVVKNAMSNDKTVPAALLRMHFHDCFVRVNFYSLISILF